MLTAYALFYLLQTIDFNILLHRNNESFIDEIIIIRGTLILTKHCSVDCVQFLTSNKQCYDIQERSNNNAINHNSATAASEEKTKRNICSLPLRRSEYRRRMKRDETVFLTIIISCINI